MTNEVGIGSSMHDFFADFWIKAQTSPLVKGWNDPGLCSVKCYHVSHSHVFPLHLGISSTFVTKNSAISFVSLFLSTWSRNDSLFSVVSFFAALKSFPWSLLFCHESHVKLAYCFIHYRSRFIFSLPESIQILNMSRFDLTLCIPLALWLISLLFLEVIGELFPISEWKSKHMFSGLWAFYRVC